MQFPNRQITNGAASSVQKDMFEIQVEHCIRDGEINAKRGIMRVSQPKLADHNRAQERRLDLVDVNSEALLPSSPQNPPANTMGNREWRKPNRQQRREHEKQTYKKKSTLEEHRLDKG
jgi:hypothetical protein